MFLLICARINGCANNRESGDLRRHRVHYDVIVMFKEVSAGFCYFMQSHQYTLPNGHCISRFIFDLECPIYVANACCRFITNVCESGEKI